MGARGIQTGLVAASAAIAALALAAAAEPAPAQGADVGRGMRLEVRGNGGLAVVRGTQRAPLSVAPDYRAAALDQIAVAGDRVTARVMDGCHAAETARRFEMSLDALEARLVNVDGYRLHRKRQYDRAAPLFRRALALDPRFRKAAGNLASALALSGKPDEALVALAPWIHADPVAVYAKVMTDPELASLRETPRLIALRAVSAGSGTLADDGSIAGAGLLWSGESGMLALVHTERSGGSCVWSRELELVHPASGAVSTVLPLVDRDETDPDCDASGKRPPQLAAAPAKRAAVAARIAAARRILADLGFAPPLHHEVGRTTETAGRARFAKAGLDVLVSNGGGSPLAAGRARVLRGGRVVATAAPAYVFLQRAVYLPAERLVVLATGRPGSEGCEGSDPTRNVVVSLADAP